MFLADGITQARSKKVESGLGKNSKKRGFGAKKPKNKMFKYLVPALFVLFVGALGIKKAFLGGVADVPVPTDEGSVSLSLKNKPSGDKKQELEAIIEKESTKESTKESAGKTEVDLNKYVKKQAENTENGKKKAPPSKKEEEINNKKRILMSILTPGSEKLDILGNMTMMTSEGSAFTEGDEIKEGFFIGSISIQPKKYKSLEDVIIEFEVMHGDNLITTVKRKIGDDYSVFYYENAVGIDEKGTDRGSKIILPGKRFTSVATLKRTKDLGDKIIFTFDMFNGTTVEYAVPSEEIR